MKVLVDATMLDGTPSGAATRLRALGAEHLSGGHVEVVHAVRSGIDPLPGLATTVLDGTTTPVGRAFAGRRLARLARDVDADLIHLGALPVPRLRDVPAVVTIHDLRFLRDDIGIGRARKLWGRRRLAPNLARTAGIVAVSAATARELTDTVGVSPQRVHVVPNAATPWLDPGAAPLDHVAALRIATKLNTRFVLHIGPPARHKNTGELMAALATLRARPEFSDVVLALAGRVGDTQAIAITQRAKRLGLPPDAVRVLGPIVDEELALLLAGADALAVPSITEGFSIPIVDAQRFGVPVVAARSPAVADTLAEGGWLVDLERGSEAFADALARALTRDDERAARIEAGRRAAERWSWETSARTLEDLWRAVAAS